MSKNPKPFNNPFQSLKLPTKQSQAASPSEVKKPKGMQKTNIPRPPTSPPPESKAESLDVYERKLFLDAVGDATPIINRERHIKPEDFQFSETSERSKLEDSMALDELKSLVGQESQWFFHREDETVEGRIDSVSHQILKSLKRGEIEPLKKLDLHGLTVPEALRKLKSWVFEVRADGVRCGLVITGRGHHSDGGIAVLQKEIPDALQEVPLSTHVLAFATAIPRHGGPGALYVLLRKRK